jgi:hypothetical protein
VRLAAAHPVVLAKGPFLDKAFHIGDESLYITIATEYPIGLERIEQLRQEIHERLDGVVDGYRDRSQQTGDVTFVPPSGRSSAYLAGYDAGFDLAQAERAEQK